MFAAIWHPTIASSSPSQPASNVATAHTAAATAASAGAAPGDGATTTTSALRTPSAHAVASASACVRQHGHTDGGRWGCPARDVRPGESGDIHGADLRAGLPDSVANDLALDRA